jgi:hypothetical protein
MKSKVSKETLRSILSDLMYKHAGEKPILMHISFPTEEVGVEWFKASGFPCPKNILPNHYYSFPEDFKNEYL